MAQPMVALVGRPNVGKSALFNRIVGQRRAIVEDIPGTTRDRLYSEADWNGQSFIVVDTGGLEIIESQKQRRPQDQPKPLSTASVGFIEEIRQQAEQAIAEADVIVMLVDVIDGLTPADEDVAQVLRRADRPVLVAANKADNLGREQAAYEFYALGLGEVFPVSALHGRGVGELLDAVVEALPPAEEQEEPEVLKIALVGRPNVGKSSLLNKLLGEERAIVSAIPGTTRDAVDTYLIWEEKPVLIIDTAGIRRRGRIEQGIEKYSVLRSIKAITRADVVILLLDARDLVTAQDAHVAGYILQESRSIIVLVNKWDLIEKDTYTMDAYTKQVRTELKFLDYVPVLFVSALTGQRVGQVIPTALEIEEERHVHLTTHELNELVQEAMFQHSPPSIRGQRLRVYFVTQDKGTPPTFIFFVNDPKLVHFGYQRFLENQIRAAHEFKGTPIKLVFKAKQEQ